MITDEGMGKDSCPWKYKSLAKASAGVTRDMLSSTASAIRVPLVSHSSFVPYDYSDNNFTYVGIINYPKYWLSVSFTHSKCECLSTDLFDLVLLSQASYFQTKV